MSVPIAVPSSKAWISLPALFSSSSLYAVGIILLPRVVPLAPLYRWSVVGMQYKNNWYTVRLMVGKWMQLFRLEIDGSAKLVVENSGAVGCHWTPFHILNRPPLNPLPSAPVLNLAALHPWSQTLRLATETNWSLREEALILYTDDSRIWRYLFVVVRYYRMCWKVAF